MRNKKDGTDIIRKRNSMINSIILHYYNIWNLQIDAGLPGFLKSSHSFKLRQRWLMKDDLTILHIQMKQFR